MMSNVKIAAVLGTGLLTVFASIAALAQEPAEEAAGAPVAETAMEAVVEATVTVADHTPEGSEVSIPAPPEGMGQVVFYRPGSMVGMAMGCTVNQGTQDDKTKISSLGNGRYVVVVAEPGTQEYWVKNERRDGLTLLVESDETQFVRCRIKMGILSGRPDLAPSDGAEFSERSDSLRLVDDDDMGQGALSSADLGIEEED